EEFHVLADTLLARGMAVAAFDGPGQGVCAATSAPEPAYHRVVGAVLDRLADAPGIDVGRAALVGMSLGGYYAAESAAHEPRLRAAVAVSGPHHLTWEQLPPFVTDTLTRRCGSAEAARAFAAAVDLRPIATRIPVPLLVVEGGTDVTPGVTTAAATADAAPHGELLLVPHGDHLLGNAQGDWLPQTADWLTSRLGTTRPA
ncbi:MAG: prolyl oligopeptidase family serine peptidase, partial [Streptomycetaceae bacterium]|nr:prolyl oligopeptidase family serine peptidase [Streptomycetaceae bacterium]